MYRASRFVSEEGRRGRRRKKLRVERVQLLKLRRRSKSASPIGGQVAKNDHSAEEKREIHWKAGVNIADHYHVNDGEGRKDRVVVAKKKSGKPKESTSDALLRVDEKAATFLPSARIVPRHCRADAVKERGKRIQRTSVGGGVLEEKKGGERGEISPSAVSDVERNPWEKGTVGRKIARPVIFSQRAERRGGAKVYPLAGLTRRLGRGKTDSSRGVHVGTWGP